MNLAITVSLVRGTVVKRLSSFATAVNGSLRTCSKQVFVVATALEA
jgi:hypothetical protein